VNNFTKRQKIGRTTLHRYIKLFERLAKDRNVDISKELEILKRMADSDVVWDEIVDISYVKPSSEYVYDISVDGLETFTTFDGIVTHNTMRTYHFAASAGIQVTLGLPRLIEIFDARKEPTTPMMTIYLKPAYNTKEKAEEFAKKIKEKRVKYYATELSVDLTNKKIKVVFGKAKKADMEEIVARLEKNLKDFNVKPTQNSIVLEAKKDISIKELERMKRKILAMYVSGVEGVKNSVVVKEGDHWIVKTLGSNLQKIFQMDEVDATKTYSNNIHEVAEILGIEAARNVLINEINNTLKQQGLHVDERHITVVVDIMCFTGEIRPIGRYGVAGSQSSVLARAGFEETIKHLVRASVRNEVDDFEGIFDNVMINQQIPAGTGMFELIAKLGEEE
jgi:DNA-directed RNA polymerase subunit A"